jgi:hypothetical protein
MHDVREPLGQQLPHREARNKHDHRLLVELGGDLRLPTCEIRESDDRRRDAKPRDAGRKMATTRDKLDVSGGLS